MKKGFEKYRKLLNKKFELWAFQKTKGREVIKTSSMK
jgi:hypothetical protein